MKHATPDAAAGDHPHPDLDLVHGRHGWGENGRSRWGGIWPGSAPREFVNREVVMDGLPPMSDHRLLQEPRLGWRTPPYRLQAAHLEPRKTAKQFRVARTRRLAVPAERVAAATHAKPGSLSSHRRRKLLCSRGDANPNSGCLWPWLQSSGPGSPGIAPVDAVAGRPVARRE
jgi:hypothetical protein